MNRQSNSEFKPVEFQGEYNCGSVVPISSGLSIGNTTNVLNNVFATKINNTRPMAIFQNTSGSLASVANTWITRGLNKTLVNTISGLTVNTSGTMTVPAGSYLFKVSGNAFYSGNTISIIQNANNLTSGSFTYAIGNNAYAQDVSSTMIIHDYITLGSQANLCVRSFGSVGYSEGLGISPSTSNPSLPNNVDITVQIEKIA